MLKRLLLTLFFITYGLALIIVLLVVRFPKEQVLAYAAGRIDAHLPGISTTIGDASYRYPFTLVFSQIRLENSVELFAMQVPQATVRFAPQRLGKEFHIDLQMLDGSVEADLAIEDDFKSFAASDIAVSSLDLGQVENLARRLDRQLQGRLSFTGSYQGEFGRYLSGALDGDMLIETFTMELKRPILQETLVAFDTISSTAQLRNGIVLLQDGEASGPSYEAKFTGQVALLGQWQESTLTVDGSIVPRQDYISQNQQIARATALLYQKYGSRAIPCTIRGSLQEPIFQFGSL